MMRAPDDYADPRVLSATAALLPAGTARRSVPDDARPGRRAKDRLGDEGTEVLERLAGRVAGVTHGADHVLPLGSGQLLELLPHRVGPCHLQQFQDAPGHQPGGLRRADLAGPAVLLLREQDDRPE